MKLHQILIILFPILFTNSAMALKSEPQFVDPSIDSDLIAKAVSSQSLLSPETDRVNVLIIGQDNRGPQSVARQTTSDDRPALASRADVIMILSVKKSSKEISILSHYRGFVPSPSCQARFGLSGADEHLLNAAYFYFGRQYFIPCLEQVTEELLKASPELATEYLDADGKFPIHAFLEGTRDNTIKPLADDLVGAMQANWWDMSWIYGSTIFDALGVFMSKDNLAAALAEKSIENISTEDINDEFLHTELKERYAYEAGGYQRAFNVALAVSYVIGWGAFGINQSQQLQFGSRYFGAAMDKNISRSVDFSFIENAFISNNDQILRYACFSNDVSPLKIVQFGEASGIYATYQNGQFKIPGRKGKYLGHLELVPFLSPPPDCNP